ncbi:MAG TPA: alpha-amylase family glycosyl hydrolase [Paenibacillus sp.]
MTLRQASHRLPSALFVSVISIVLLLAGCSSDSSKNISSVNSETPAANTSNSSNTANSANLPANSSKGVTAIDTQPSTVYYEIFVRSFYDSDGDGIGDFKGLTEKLDYIKDLGIEGIWLMPINPSPSYHGYDVTDYRSINPDYGTMEDFKQFLDEAHRRGIKVIMDLVVNHTSTKHPWFIDSASSTDSKYRNWYTWAGSQNLKTSGSSAAGSGNPWHPLNGDDYLGIFSEGMPDLNFDNPDVRTEIEDIGRFWLEQGLDGFRLDAAKHIFENLITDKGQATTDKNVKWWQEFRQSLEQVKPDVYLVGEIWDPSAGLISFYLDNALDSGFNFSLSETLISMANKEKDSNLAFTLARTYKLYSEKSGGKFVDATFLTNHDLNRVMTQLDGNLNHAKMAAGLLLTIPGNPFIYYGEEIGMLGAKPDESIREPMQWYKGGSGAGQTTWEQTNFNTGQEGTSVDEQLADADSLLSYYHKLIQMRSSIPALKNGAISEYDVEATGIAAYLRQTEQQTVLVVHNLTANQQTVDLMAKETAYGFAKILDSTKEGASLEAGKLTIPGYTTLILE